jgi:hypothetical protein
MALASPLFLTTCQMTVCGLLALFPLAPKRELSSPQNTDVLRRLSVCILTTSALMGQNFAYEQLPISFISVLKVLLHLDQAHPSARNYSHSRRFDHLGQEQYCPVHEWSGGNCHRVRAFSFYDWQSLSSTAAHRWLGFLNLFAWCGMDFR